MRCRHTFPCVRTDAIASMIARRPRRRRSALRSTSASASLVDAIRFSPSVLSASRTASSRELAGVSHAPPLLREASPRRLRGSAVRSGRRSLRADGTRPPSVRPRPSVLVCRASRRASPPSPRGELDRPCARGTRIVRAASPRPRRRSPARSSTSARTAPQKTIAVASAHARERLLRLIDEIARRGRSRRSARGGRPGTGGSKLARKRRSSRRRPASRTSRSRAARGLAPSRSRRRSAAGMSSAGRRSFGSG